MNQQAVNPSAYDNNAENQASLSSSFKGFEPLNSNYVYCPNQFFDICLKSNSRGMVRIVAYMIRQTLGWLDENGEPVQQTVKVSYNDLIRKAGVSRGAIAPALQKAVALGFLECHQPGQAKGKNTPGQSASYTLRWDYGSEYKKSVSEFCGFFAGEGNRTPVPNAFFDTVIPCHALAIAKVVGAIIRNSIGYQNQFGHRRQNVSLSYSNLQFHTGLSDRTTLATAIRESIDAGFIARLESGIFDPNQQTQASANYGMRWLDRNENQVISSKTRPEKSTNENRFKNQTRISPKIRPGDQFKNPTSIEKTNSNNTLKQQAVVKLDGVIESLIKAGFDRHSAGNLLRERGVEVVKRQLDWIDARNPKNKTAMLRRAIELDWEASKRVEGRLQNSNKSLLNSFSFSGRFAESRATVLSNCCICRAEKVCAKHFSTHSALLFKNSAMWRIVCGSDSFKRAVARSELSASGLAGISARSQNIRKLPFPRPLRSFFASINAEKLASPLFKASGKIPSCAQKSFF